MGLQLMRIGKVIYRQVRGVVVGGEQKLGESFVLSLFLYWLSDEKFGKSWARSVIPMANRMDWVHGISTVGDELYCGIDTSDGL